MRGLRNVLWPLLLAGLAVATALGVSAAIPSGEKDILFSVGSAWKMTFLGTGSGIAVLTAGCFAAIWTGRIRKQKEKLTTGDRINGLGFGLLPAAAVWKAFEAHSAAGTGKALFEPLPAVPWLSSDGCFQPSRIELCAAATGFLILVLWLILRKEAFSGNGDLLLTVLYVWCAVRSVTERFRLAPWLQAGNGSLAFWACLGGEILCAGIWTVRRCRKEGYAVLNMVELGVIMICAAERAADTIGAFTVGSRIGDLAVSCGCAALSLTLALFMGKESRS